MGAVRKTSNSFRLNWLEIAEANGTEAMSQDAVAFFAWHKIVHPLYERFHEKLLAVFPGTRARRRSPRFPTATATSPPAYPS